ncbi:MAG: hypothetical protein H6730_38590 [Deltaproteobacteria bacterium]|nr:hypothetical protein [Deltaproteobacteria bacterium]
MVWVLLEAEADPSLAYRSAVIPAPLADRLGARVWVAPEGAPHLGAELEAIRGRGPAVSLAPHGPLGEGVLGGTVLVGAPRPQLVEGKDLRLPRASQVGLQYATRLEVGAPLRMTARELQVAFDAGVVGWSTPVELRSGLTSYGRQRVVAVLPPVVPRHLGDRPLDRPAVEALLRVTQLLAGEAEAMALFEALRRVGDAAAEGSVSLSIDDLAAPPEKALAAGKLARHIMSVHAMYYEGTITFMELFNYLWREVERSVTAVRVGLDRRSDDAGWPAVLFGLRSTELNRLMGLPGGPGTDCPDELPTTSSFAEGLNPMEYWMHARRRRVEALQAYEARVDAVGCWQDVLELLSDLPPEDAGETARTVAEIMERLPAETHFHVC